MRIAPFSPARWKWAAFVQDQIAGRHHLSRERLAGAHREGRPDEIRAAPPPCTRRRSLLSSRNFRRPALCLDRRAFCSARSPRCNRRWAIYRHVKGLARGTARRRRAVVDCQRGGLIAHCRPDALEAAEMITVMVVGATKVKTHLRLMLMEREPHMHEATAQVLRRRPDLDHGQPRL